MFKKFGIGMLAILLAASFSAFTTPAKQATTAQSMDLYWYKVHGNQITDANDLYDVGPRSAITSPCNAGNTKDCLRGFEQELDFSNGAVTASGADQIQTNQQVP